MHPGEHGDNQSAIGESVQGLLVVCHVAECNKFFIVVMNGVISGVFGRCKCRHRNRFFMITMGMTSLTLYATNIAVVFVRSKKSVFRNYTREE